MQERSLPEENTALKIARTLALVRSVLLKSVRVSNSSVLKWLFGDVSVARTSLHCLPPAPRTSVWDTKQLPVSSCPNMVNILGSDGALNAALPQPPLNYT